MKKTLLYLLMIVVTPIAKGVTISCTHNEICRMAQLLQNEAQRHEFNLETIISIKGDPHEFEPSVEEIKKLIVAPYLIVGPNELNPWMKQIRHARKKNIKLQTISLLLPSSAQTDYPTKDTDALGHFWLYPKIYCSFKAYLASELKLSSSIKCDNRSIEKLLTFDLAKIRIPIIFTHDALIPLLTKLSKDKNQIIAIKGSSHHEEASSFAIKKVYDALAGHKVIWVLENNIAVPENIKSKIRKSDIVITIDTANSIGVDNDFEILYSFHRKLQDATLSI